MSTQSETINELAAALSKAQAKIEGAIKDSTNPFFKSKYADIGAVIDAIKQPLAENGLCVTQLTDFDEDGPFVETQISHSSGQWMRGRFPIYSKDKSPQALGSATSYSRRYSLQAALCVSAVDDDGEVASHKSSERLPEKKPLITPLPYITTTPTVPPPNIISPLQLKRFHAIVGESGWSHEEAKAFLKEFCNIESSRDMKKSDYEEICEFIQNNPKLGRIPR